VKRGNNTVDVTVVNFWANRLIGDSLLPAGERKTKTNIRNIRKDLMPSGLLGPVTIQK
jgi:hypothetical protein